MALVSLIEISTDYSSPKQVKLFTENPRRYYLTPTNCAPWASIWAQVTSQSFIWPMTNSAPTLLSWRLLQKGEVDIAISPWWPTFYALGGVDTISIDTFKLVLVASPSLLKGEEINELEQLRPYVELTNRESGLDFDSEKLTLLPGIHQWKTQDSLTLKHMLLAGLGWGLVPEHLVERELKEGALLQIQLNDTESVITGDVRAVRKQDKTPGPVASHLWECFKQQN